MENKEDKEITEFLESIKNNSINPDLNFKAELKEKFIDKNNTFNFSNMNFDNFFFRLKALSMEAKAFTIFASFSIIVLSTYGIFTLTNILNQNSSEQISVEEQEDIYKKIIENNPKSILEEQAKEIKKTEVINDVLSDPFVATQNTQTSVPNPETADTIYSRLEEVSKQLNEITNQPPIGSPSDITFNPEFNYSYSKRIYTQGPKVCNVMQYGEHGIGGEGFISNQKDTITEYFDYSEYYNRYFYKIKTTNSNLNLINYLLSKNDRTQNNTLVFAEGDYAIRSNYPVYNYLPVSYPTSYPSSYPTQTTYPQNMSLQQAMDYYFGRGIKIDKIYQEDGNEYVQLSRSYTSLCNWDPESIELIQPKSIFIYVYTVNKANYNIENTKIYLSEEKPENLVTETSFSRETRKATFEEIDDVFDYEYSKPVKDLYYSSSMAYESLREDRLQRILDYIAQNNLNLLVPSREHYTLSYIFTDSPLCYTDWCNLYYSRAFFPMNDFGQDLYDERIRFLKSNPVFAKPIVSMFFKSKHHGYTHDIQVNLYPSDQSETKIRNTQLYYNQSENSEIENGAVNLLINNQLNVGNYYEVLSRYDYVSYPVSFPASYPVSYPDGNECVLQSCFYKNGRVTLSYRDSNYLITYNGDRRDYLSDISYSTLNVSDQADADVFRVMLQTVY